MPFSSALLVPLYLDLNIFCYWIKGVPVDSISEEEHVISYILSQYRNFTQLKHYFQDVKPFLNVTSLPISYNLKIQLINKYYSLDDQILFALFEKKLKSKSRRDLKDVSEKAGVHLESCRRQFDNVKRIFKKIEGIAGSKAPVISKLFELNPELAQTYSQIYFAHENKIEIQKRRPEFLSVNGIKSIVQSIMTNWCVDEEFNPSIVSCMKDIRYMLISQKEQMDIVRSYVFMGVSDSELFKQIFKNLMSFGSCVGSSKEGRDIILNVYEKIFCLIKCRSPSGAQNYLDMIIGGVNELKLKEKEIQSFNSYMKGIKEIIQIFFEEINM